MLSPKECSRFIPVVGVAVAIDLGSVYAAGTCAYLMGRRRGSHGAGTLAFPGGHLEHGETVAQAAVREVREETGLTVEVSPHILYVSESPLHGGIVDGQGMHYLTLVVRGRIVPGTSTIPQEIEPDKFTDLRWVPWLEMASLNPGILFAPAQAFVDHLRRLGRTPSDLVGEPTLAC